MKKNLLILCICIICSITLVAVSLHTPADGRKEGPFHFEKLLSDRITSEQKSGFQTLNMINNLNGNIQQN